MALSNQIQSDLRTAMKARDTERVATLRMVVAAFKTAQVAEGHSGDLTDAEAIDLLNREAKKRNDAASAYAEAGRPELADRERRELEVIRDYLPAQLDDAELRAIVDEAVTQTGANGSGDLGRVMSQVMPQVRGRADGKRVNAIVRERLS